MVMQIKLLVCCVLCCIENSGETASMQMTVEVVAVDIHRRIRHLNYQYRAVVNF